MTTYKVTPPCECGSPEFKLLEEDYWEDRVTLECIKCKGILDTPIGARRIEKIK